MKRNLRLTQYRLQNAIFIFLDGWLILKQPNTAFHINTVFKKLITGLGIPQQYVCVALEELSSPLAVTLTFSGEDHTLDVTQRHLFIGYKPLIIAVTLSSREPQQAFDRADTICLNFHHQPFVANSRWSGFVTDSKAVARLVLKRIYEKVLGEDRVLFYEGVQGRHSFISSWHQFVNRQREKIRPNPVGNVNLPGNLHDMVRIAYAVPRIIPLITLREGEKMNMFPTDLHGPVLSKFYISSLRLNGKANSQVDRLKRLALSYMDVQAFKDVYALGKNHMQELRERALFNCAPHVSKTYEIPLPREAIRYRELNQTGSFDAGIHRIHFYEQVHEEKLKEGLTLAHIHQYYAQWRLDHGMPTHLLLR
ncbi:hypothetical protein KK083_18935 [Fulvivirgaceae bacterium PWU4]|uniref:Uncharacterized protein n=1 Tax=Chryseosolibacter histidini TaxID=2782349 RepID=A0AAP2GQX3_9BACT|nr:hypothetical protein [Chryseosolibacter histidini]